MKASLQKTVAAEGGEALPMLVAQSDELMFSMTPTADIALLLAATLPDAAQAEKGKTEIEAALAPLLGAAEPGNPMMPALAEFKKSVSTTVEDRTVSVRAKLTQAEIDQVTNMAAMFLPMLMMQFQQEAAGGLEIDAAEEAVIVPSTEE